ncbi:MAG: PAS domain S-box protein [Gemmataceae bacterium]|nr:PAS domain S-box protein [Gemmataceae bacterium]
MTRSPDPARTPAAADADLFAGGGGLGRLMAGFDWAATPLGPPRGWPQSLTIAVRILLTSRYAMWLGWGPDFTFFYNDAYARMTLGPKHPWALGRSAKEVWAEIWADIGPRADRVIATGEATWDESLLLFLQRNGYPEETYHTFSYSPLPDDAGGVGGMLCVVTEDTDRTIGERRLRTLRELAARTATEARTAEDACRASAAVLADNPRDLPFVLVYLADPDGRAARLAGSAGVAPGSAAAPEVVSPADDAVWPFARVARTRAADVVARGLPPLPGGPYPEPPNRAVVLPVLAAGQDRPAGFVVAGVSPRLALDDAYRGFLDLVAGHVGTAVANARAFEDQKRRAEALAEIDRAKTAFFSNVSHEFRTPLTLMLGPVDDLLGRPNGDLSEAGREQLALVRRNGRRLQKLVNTLLDFSRIEAGRTRAVFAPTDLPALTADLASNFRSAAERAGLRLVVDCPPLPAPVHVDREMWEKVVLNLLSNALKYTFDGELRVTVRADGGRAVLTVDDTGAGIPPADLPRVFDRFHRVEGSRGRTHEGTGIGLSLVRELVHLHGGEVGVESAVGVGTAFTVAVPFGTAHLPADQVAAAPAPGGDTGAFVEEVLGWLSADQGSGVRGQESGRPGAVSDSCLLTPDPSARSADRARVLLADDNADMRGYVGRLLAGRYAVEAVADGQAALDAARANPPDLVLTDVMMPRLDGFGLLAALRADPALANLPVILLSARAGEEARVEGLRAGADDYLVKPLAAGELLARVDGLVALAAARREAAARRAETVGILESITEGFAALDRDWRITYFNAAAERLNGVRREDVLGKTHWEVYPATVGTELERHYRRAMADRVPVRFENFYEPWGRWFEVNLHPMTDGGLAVYWRDTTDAKRAATALREKEERLALLTGHATDYAIILTDPAGVVTDWLAGAEGITGWSPAEAVGRPADLIFTPEDRAAGAPEKEMAKARAEGRAEDKRWHLRKDGTRFFADGVMTALRDEAGGLRGFGKVFRDATAAKLSEEWLRESEERFRELADAAPAMTWVTDPAGRCTYLSRRWYETTGQTEAEGLGLGWTDATHPDDRDRAGAALLAANAARGPFAVDYRLRQADGSYRWALDAGRPRFGPDGAYLGMVGNVFDVHDRRAAEERYRTLFESMDQGFCVAEMVFDPAGRPEDYRILEMNPAFERHTGLRGVVGKSVAEFAPDLDRFWHETYGRVARTGEPTRFVSQAKALGDRWFDVYAFRLGGEGSNKVAILFTDITARKRAEEALREADKRKDEFLALLAHELRNPLAPLRNSLQIVRLAPPDSPAAAHARAVMDRQLAHMVRLIDDLLDVSRITRGKMELRKGPTTLAEVVAAAVESAGPVVEAAGHTLTVDLPPDPVHLDADLTRLAQVLANLLTNSAKYTPRGGRVELIAECGMGNAESKAEDPAGDSAIRNPQSAFVTVTVRDDGMGIPAEFLPRLFDMFSQVDRGVEKATGGLGIGLALVKGLTEMHGGAVAAESPGPGHGSTFTVRLPTIAECGMRDAESKPEEEAASSGFNSALRNPNSAIKRRVLVVDDNRDSAESMAEMLRLLGNEVAVAHDGLAAVEAAGRTRPDLILMDVGMPKLNGLDATRRIRQHDWGAGMTILALTGWGQDDDRERSRAAGCDGHLVKPVGLADLDAAVSRLRPAG